MLIGHSLLVLRQREALLAVLVIFPPRSSTAVFSSSLFLESLPTVSNFIPVRGLSTEQAHKQIQSPSSLRGLLSPGGDREESHISPPSVPLTCRGSFWEGPAGGAGGTGDGPGCRCGRGRSWSHLGEEPVLPLELELLEEGDLVELLGGHRGVVNSHGKSFLLSFPSSNFTPFPQPFKLP